jgi:Flp pilus assembly protein TadG
MVLLTPVLVLLMLFVVFLGRAGGATDQVRHAADQAARAASLVARPRMQAVAQVVAVADLADNGFNCATTAVTIGVSDTASEASVTVTVACEVNQQGTELLRAQGRVLTASSTEIIDRYRAG